jgi:Zn-dependent protease
LHQPDLFLALLWYAAFVFSTATHEAAHALSAYLGGDSTAYRAGQVTLNPVPHMRREPFGMIFMPLFGVLTSGWCVGWASTPFDPRWAARHPRRAAWMAAAGPAANVAIAFVALLLLRGGLELEIFAAPGRVSFSRLVESQLPVTDAVGSFLSILLVLNAILALFNLIPFPPLDGASAITLLLPEVLAERWRAVAFGGSFGLFGLFAAWWLFGRIVPRVFDVLIALVHPGGRYG